MGLYERARNIVKANLSQLSDTQAKGQGGDGLKKTILALEESRRELRFMLSSLERESERLESQRSQAEAELELWEKRLLLARQNARADLVERAQSLVAEHRHEVVDLSEQEHRRQEKRRFLEEQLSQIDEAINQVRRGELGVTASKPPILNPTNQPPVDPLEAEFQALEKRQPPSAADPEPE